MVKRIPHTRIRIFAFRDSEQTTENAINNFNKLLIAERIFDKKWGIVRKPVNGQKNSFHLGGGKVGLPARQITFDSEALPNKTSFFDNEDNELSEEQKNWCNSANIFLLCIDLQNLPETWEINRVAYNIKQADRKKTVLYAMFIDNQIGEINNFDAYANMAVALNKDLPDDDYLFPYTISQRFITPPNRRFNLRKEVFCFDKSGGQNFGCIDCLLYCINIVYADTNNEITMTNNKLYHYITTIINYKLYKNMARLKKIEKIKLAVVGVTNTGKSFFINDVLKALSDKGIGIDANDPNHDSNYASAYDYLTRKERLKTIKFTGSNVLLTRAEDHFKGTSKSGKFTLEFMDIPGEAFRNANRVAGVFNKLKSYVREHYTIPWHKRVIKNTPNHILVLLFPFTLIFLLINGIVHLFFKLQDWILSLFKRNPQNIVNHNYFVEEHWVDGKAKIIKIRLNNQREETTQNVMPRDSELSEAGTISDKQTNYKFKGNYHRTGEYVVEHFEKYDTKSLIETLKDIVVTRQNDVNYTKEFEYEDSENEMIDISTDPSFWNYFYAYVFCDTCTDFVVCDLLAVHKPSGTASTSETVSKPATFEDCINGCNAFIDKNKKKYLIFRGMDALLEQSNEDDNILNKLFKEETNKVELAPYIYFLIHLAIYKKYMIKKVSKSEFEKFLEELKNKDNTQRFINKLRHLLKDPFSGRADLSLDDIEITLDEILQEEIPTNFVVPNIGSENLETRLDNRIDTFLTAAPSIKDLRSGGRVTGITTNCIYPHIYFTAHPIHKSTLKIYKNEMGSAVFCDNNNGTFDKAHRFPLGVYNFVADMLFQHGIGDYCTSTDMEVLLRS